VSIHEIQPRDPVTQQWQSPTGQGLDVPLGLTDEEWNAEGTYNFPPVPMSASQVIDFWTRVPLSDRLLRAVQNDHYAARNDPNSNEALSREAEKVRQTWIEANPKEDPDRATFKTDAKVDAWNRQMGRLWDKAMKDLNEGLDVSIPRTSIRSVVRAQKMLSDAYALADDEREQVFDHPLPFEGGYETVVDLCRRFRLDHIAPTLNRVFD
jgi:hypothetical protein